MSGMRMVIVGGGVSGLTAGAYLVRSGHEVLILEKTSRCGGLVSSFQKEGFVFDTGPRAFGNAGILVPMLDDLKIRLPLVKGPVSTGIKDEIVHYDDRGAVRDYIASLKRLFPESREDVGKIEKNIIEYCSVASVMNRVPNPFIKNPLRDLRFLFREFLPWLPSFLRALAKTSLRKRTVEEALDALTDNSSLKDMVCQHFFKGTPASFALGYFENYLDYQYPLGGTGALPRALEEKIVSGGGVIVKEREVVKIFPAERKLVDRHGEEYPYDRLLWAADLRSLYRRLDGSSLAPRVFRSVEREGRRYLSALPGESAFTIFLGVDESPGYFAKISRGHFIYTPRSDGLGGLHRSRLEDLKKNFPRVSQRELLDWLRDFCERNSYEISIPVLKDRSLAPPGKTGLVISVLCDGGLFAMAERAGRLDELREKTRDFMLDALERSVYPGLGRKILFVESAAPVTLMRMFNTANGAITGWSLEGKPPVPSSLTGITAAVKTAVPGVFKSGQWSYSPAGVPIAILTGRIAATAMGRNGASW
ncbi:MAG: NAD(P)/FAD-dependent oxidoreductase [Spirochaetales bacterium]|nr:NAD(P)/FAD-dependent oxidoreductase [Spirochaetales bacterium]